MAKFRLRLLLNRVPFLDGLRLSVLSWICNVGAVFSANTYPIIRVTSEKARELLDSNSPVIFGVYHGRMIGLLHVVNPRNRLTVLMSQSRDGEIIARASEGIGFSVARGSPARGAVEGAMKLIDAAKAGQNLAIMVDGPRGPIHQVKPGIVRISQLTGLPIVPFVCFGRANMWMWGWDKFMASRWSTPTLYLYGDPIHVSKEASEDELELLRLQLDREMNRLRDVADGYWSKN